MTEENYNDFMDCIIQANYLLSISRDENHGGRVCMTAKQKEIIALFLRKMFVWSETAYVIPPAEERPETN